jgi:hypothetical protein
MLRISKLGPPVLTVLAGGALGWIVGLSSTPIVATVVPALLALLVAVATALSGLDEKHERTRTMLYPSALLVVGAGIGIGFGVAAKSRDWLSPEPAEIADRWSEIDRKAVLHRLFDRTEPQPGGPGDVKAARTTGLWASTKMCGYYLQDAPALTTVAQLTESMDTYKLPFASLAKDIPNAAVLRAATVRLCQIALDGGAL